MSKVSKLKQEAYDAGKKRDWGKVIVLYERILELDSKNPALINELGDAYLKRGNVARAIEHFLDAAEKYQATGLVNNAVAIYKKILRFDGGNMNAHWFLAESRVQQGLVGEGVAHALQFLSPCEKLGSEYRSAFLKRCVKMLSLFPDQSQVLARLTTVFRFWAMPLETARVAVLQACLARDAGRGERATKDVTALLEEFPELGETPEHERWQGRPGAGAEEPPPAWADHNAISLGSAAAGQAGESSPASDGGSDGPADEGAVRAPGPDVPEADGPVADRPDSLAQSLGLVDLAGSSPDGGFPLAGLDPERADPGPTSPTADAGTQPAAASAAAGPRDTPDDEIGASEAEREDDRLEIEMDEPPDLGELIRDMERPAQPPEPPPAEPKVDLLAEILSEESTPAADGEAQQLDTIVNEIGQQVGGGPHADPTSQYDMGLVYLEMGLFDQAEECFEVASRSPEHALRSYEMWGVALIRKSRFEEAIDIMGRGLRIPGATAHDLLGLLYHTGQAYELAGRTGAAREYYERVHHAAPDFLDTEKRLEALESV